MARLTEEMVIARTKQSELSVIKNLNCCLLRQMPNVEVLAFSINKLRGLEVFASCRRLRELYVRKNEIRDLAEIRHLKHLPDLTSLYRLTVLRNLPHLEKLDNISVQPDEVQEAMRRGTLISDSDDEGFPHQVHNFIEVVVTFIYFHILVKVKVKKSLFTINLYTLFSASQDEVQKLQ
ncbi:unnamed protein product [Leptidea sinapis]|uniref:U2A'/phosphoprotein 32 family A C-terminal domain-containing protein n=1 Tax=Leptidea sinapis TaxID=189913 RepID=A0A5E4QTE8_9NEOP|nr:unnamed protein product [Leptidea sinapis]